MKEKENKGFKLTVSQYGTKITIKEKNTDQTLPEMIEMFVTLLQGLGFSKSKIIDTFNNIEE